MLFFYLRHGDPVYNPDSLTPLGQRQAEALARRLAQFGLDRIYASSSTRALQTAQPTCELLKRQPIVLEWCHEHLAYSQLDYAGKDGRRTWLFQNAEMRRFLNSPEIRKLGVEWFRHEAFAGTPYAEGIRRIAKETDAFLAELGYRHLPEQGVWRAERPNAERVALFAHQGFGQAFLSWILDIPYPLFSTHFDMGHTGMTVIEFPEEEGEFVPCVLELANDGHLWREGLPTHYQNRVRF